LERLGLIKGTKSRPDAHILGGGNFFFDWGSEAAANKMSFVNSDKTSYN